jgi:beta-glucanase (GH16 family)
MVLALVLFTAAFDPSPLAGRHLVFSYDFRTRKRLDSKDWIFDDGPSYNNELEKYTSASGGNASIKDGTLVIEAKKVGTRITSARLETTKAWRYGYVEVEAKVPPGRGTWPAIWMLNDRLRHRGDQPGVGWPECGEIDIMENVGYDPASFHYSLHSKEYNWMVKKQRTLAAPLPHPEAFHKFGLDWRTDSITFYADGKATYHVDKTEDTFAAWPFRDPFYLILNLAIGGTWGGAKGVDDKIFPSRYYIRSVKIYQ